MQIALATKAKFLFLDYGGVLDSHGVHTRVLFWDAVVNAGLVANKEANRRAFQEAYTWADQEMMRTGSAKGMGLSEFNQHNLQLIFKKFGPADSGKVMLAAQELTAKMRNCLAESEMVLKNIKLPMGVISNFTGNLENILKEQKLFSYFEHITESFVVGAAKPELAIFLHALSQVKFAPNECLYVGDNIKNDLEPARKLGIQTVHFNPTQEISEYADYTIREITELLTIV
jgi:HAD superfamily hydrolase (TIGR01549 family)